MKAGIKRLGRGAFIMLLVTFTVQWLFSLLPGSAADVILGQNATPENVAELNHQLGLDRPFWQQYLSWLGNALHGNLGTSPVTHLQVASAIVDRLAVTLELTLLGMIGALVIAVAFAVVSASKPGGVPDRILNALSSVLLAVPVFVAGPLLIYVLALQLHMFPVLGWSSLREDGLGANLLHVALPALAIALNEIAAFHRLLRADLITTLNEDYIDAARARGMSPAFVMARHALRPASLSLVTVIGINLGRLLSGAVVVETLFSLPGLGQLAVSSIVSRDVVMVQGVVAFIAIVYVAINTMVDMSYGVLDPRVRRKAWA